MQRHHANLILALFLFMVALSSPVIALNTSSPFGQKHVLLQPDAQAQQAIDAAQTAINTAYTDLMLADSTGASITDLLGSLNGAITELNQARSAYNDTDYTSAITLAESAQATADSVSIEASTRRSATLVQQQAQIIIIIGVVIITVFITYFALTRIIRYQREKKQEFLRMEIRLPDEEEDGEDT
ncbi:MAG: hypothetical protein ACFE8O_07400 [Candidatus Hermodarchaeota archaeon]